MATRVLLQEGREGVLRLGADAGRDAGRDHVKDRDPGVVVPGERVGELEGKLGVGSAADGHEDPLDIAEGALLDDRDVARRVANDGIDRGREDGAGPAPRPSARPPQPKMSRSASTSCAASTIPSAARRPIRTSGRIRVPCGA